MVAGKYDMICEQGATFVRNLVWQDENEVPVNLTGYTARMHVRQNVQSNALILPLTTENGGISLTPETGGIRLFLSASATDPLQPRRAVYDLELVAPDGFVTRLVEGTFTIVPQVTR
jgi:hypothetical protein